MPIESVEYVLNLQLFPFDLALIASNVWQARRRLESPFDFTDDTILLLKKGDGQARIQPTYLPTSPSAVTANSPRSCVFSWIVAFRASQTSKQ